MTNETTTTDDMQDGANAAGVSRALLVDKILDQTERFIERSVELTGELSAESNNENERLEDAAMQISLASAGFGVARNELRALRVTVATLVGLIKGMQGILKAENLKMDSIEMHIGDTVRQVTVDELVADALKLLPDAEVEGHAHRSHRAD